MFGLIMLVLAALAISAGAAVYFLGIPSELKEKAEKAVAENLAEGAAKDALREQIRSFPEADRDKVDALSSGINKLTGGDVNNPLGRFGKTGKSE